MEDQKETVSAEKTEEEKAEEKLPFCTTAPSAEHSRGADEDEPCEDFRDGD